MIVKGIVSAIDEIKNTAEVILPEYDGAVTAMIPFYQSGRAAPEMVGQFVIVAVFNNDFNDAVIL